MLPRGCLPYHIHTTWYEHPPCAKLTPLGPQSRFGDILLVIRVVCPHIWEGGYKRVKVLPAQEWYQHSSTASRGDRQNKKKRHPGCLAHAVRRVFYSVVANRCPNPTYLYKHTRYQVYNMEALRGLGVKSAVGPPTAINCTMGGRLGAWVSFCFWGFLSFRKSYEWSLLKIMLHIVGWQEK